MLGRGSCNIETTNLLVKQEVNIATPTGAWGVKVGQHKARKSEQGARDGPELRIESSDVASSPVRSMSTPEIAWHLLGAGELCFRSVPMGTTMICMHLPLSHFQIII
jgi:hypothetical protein